MDGDRRAIATGRHPETWLEAVEIRGHGITTDDLLTSEEAADEMLLMGLRLAEGLDSGRYEALSGRPFDPVRLKALGDYGMVETTETGRLRATRAGWSVLDAVVADLAA